MAGSTGPCSPSVRWPSPRLKAGALGVLSSRPQLADNDDFCGATRSSQMCYLTARLGTRRSRSPQPRQPLTARAIRNTSPRRDGSPLGKRKLGEPLSWKMPPLFDPAVSSRSHSLEPPAVPFTDRSPSATAPPEGVDRLLQTGSKSPMPKLIYPSSMRIEERIRRVCEESLDGIRPRFDIPGALSLCRADLQVVRSDMEDLENVITDRRSRRYKASREEERQQAARWKVQQKIKEREDLEKMRQKEEAEEEERRKATEFESRLNRDQLRERKKSNFRKFLSTGEGPRRNRRRSTHSELEEPASPGLRGRRNTVKVSSPVHVHTRRPSAFGAIHEQERASAEPTRAHSDRATVAHRRVGHHATWAPEHGDVSHALSGALSSAIGSGVPRFSVAVGQGVHPHPHLPHARTVSLSGNSHHHPDHRHYSQGPLGHHHGKTAPPKNFESVDQRLERVRRAKYIKSRADQKAREEDDRCARFEALADTERLALQNSFSLYEERTATGLDLSGLRKALIEIGLQGMTTEEWALLTNLCIEYSPKRKKNDERRDEERERRDDERGMMKVGCNLYRFAVGVVPAVRIIIRDHRRGKLEQQCSKIKRDWESSRLDADALLAAVLDVFPLQTDTHEPDAAIEAVMEALNAFIAQEAGHIEDLACTLQELTERQQRMANDAQQDLRQEFQLSDQTFEYFRPQLLVLYRLFRKLDADSAGLVDIKELLILFKELQIFNSKYDREYRDMAKLKVQEASPLDFHGFLQLLWEIHGLMDPVLEQQTYNVKRHFDLCQVDDEFEVAPYVHLESIEDIFKNLGIQVQDPCVRSVMRRMLAKADVEGIGHHMLDTVKKLYLSIKERTQQYVVWNKYCAAEALNFKIPDMRDIQNVFDKLDTDRSLLLEPAEVKQACTMLNLNLGKDSHFNVAFGVLDKDRSGGLDFLEFMQFLKMVRDKEGPFRDPATTPVTNLKAFDRMELILLMECFSERDYAIDKVSSLHIDRLLTDACSLLDVEATTSLETACSVTTLQELLEHARWSQEVRRSRSRDRVNTTRLPSK